MYAVEQDIIDRYGEDELLVAFDRNNDGLPDTDAVNKALADASDEVDGYLAGRYSLPLADPPRILTFMAVDIALYKGSGSNVPTEEKRKRYDDAVKFLRSVAKGEIGLGEGDPAQGSGSGASFSTAERIFTREKMRGL